MVEKALDDMESIPFELSLGGSTSVILDDEMLHDLSQGLPLHWVGYGMRPVFSTDHDGFSLNSLYRKTEEVKNVVLLLIRDTTNTTFGAVLSERMRCSLHFYGTGESCVFHWKPTFKRYDWTKKNYFFMRGAPDCFLIGAKSGHSAIWFDESLKYGRSEATDTFDNPVLCGQSMHAAKGVISRIPSSKSLQPNDVCLSSVPFIIDQLEVWEMCT
ncbi:unnamed protein product [Dibothriocephalus latus]|uniref:Oxidation resistance protein 1 n=1 Tax=Dibothriocephalus latus TaxID=60516 RepID=A0A3P7LCT0_DIBLA|nr:unnamed protein product [Dibothriocephalus latus]